jgi:GTP cyclohydrolase III
MLKSNQAYVDVNDATSYRTGYTGNQRSQYNIDDTMIKIIEQHEDDVSMLQSVNEAQTVTISPRKPNELDRILAA